MGDQPDAFIPDFLFTDQSLDAIDVIMVKMAVDDGFDGLVAYFAKLRQHLATGGGP